MKTDNTDRILYLDCFSGLSGDMIVSSLIDVGVPLAVIEEAAAALPISGYRLRHEKEVRSAVSVSRFFVDVEEAAQPHRHFSHIRDMILQSALSDDVKQLSIRIFEILAQAEAKVHGTTVDKVHFHEVGAVDSIVDIVGAAAAIVHLQTDIACAVIPLGKGFVKTQHGVLPLPAPATLNILSGVPVEGTSVESELTTPTGAAIVKALSSSFGSMPPMIPESIGFGAGARSLPDRPGILRAVLGKKVETKPEQSCVVLEANIDDMTGEVAAYAMTKLLEDGALDVWLENIHMKKGRPALKFCVLCRSEDRERLGDSLMTETTTIGLRYYGVGRMELRRSFVTVNTEWGPVQMKVSLSDEGIKSVSAEFEDCKNLANAHGLVLKDVISAAVVAYHRQEQK
ncbi:MAG: nickel pincer cofactor biosynthesis protein LarC [Deltaproteobacteria bacterium]|nr:nickel pincer cofactor biosynthesis protein LarC [Deltaproteobacteria bacterium]MBN2672494.1 nickel pincer cofactor biosynthesis protein LarC [Deltaproteobacteria bacterium]